jgi:hypothetical protein
MADDVQIAPLSKEPVWSNESNYYAHLRNYWDNIRLARMRLNNSPNGNIYDGFSALEDWFESQKAVADLIAPFEKELIQKVDERRDLIHALTKNLRFADLGQGATSELWIKIKQQLELNERDLCTTQAGLGLFMKRKTKKNQEEYLV